MSERDWSIPLSDLDVDDEIVAAVEEAIRSSWWSMGPRVGQFEEAFAGFCRSRHAFAVSSGTAALQLALHATGCGTGDEIILPSLNFVAAANAVVQAGATPVFCDVKGPHDLNLDPSDLEAAVGPATKAVIVLHYGGFPCDMDAVGTVAERHSLLVFEDAAHAPGASWRGRPCGTLGLVGCFSFFSNKNLPIGEGGMLLTDDDAIAERIRLLRSHGMTTLTWERHRGHASSYDVVAPGFNFRLDEVRAAIGLVRLRQLRGTNAARARLAGRYRAALDGVEGVHLPFGDPRAQADSAHHLAVAVLPEGVARENVRKRLAAHRIQTSVHYPPIHRFTAYAGLNRRALPRTEALAPRLLTLPLYPRLEDGQLDAVCAALLTAVRDER